MGGVAGLSKEVGVRRFDTWYMVQDLLRETLHTQGSRL